MKLVEMVSSILRRKGREIFSLPPHASVYDAIEMMADKHVGALLVISEGKLVGVISERDYARKVILKGRASKETRVDEIMTRSIITVGPEHRVDECMRIMTDNRIRHLPVMEGEKVLGIISIGDLVNWIISAQEQAIDQLENYITGKYPA
jgi:CBS domain-containing protein